MTFEQWLSRTPAGSDPDSPCFQWDKERVTDLQKAKSSGWPWGILYPLSESIISEDSTCCQYWERLYNLKVLLCPRQFSPNGNFWHDEASLLDEFVQQLRIISDKNFKHKYPTAEAIDEVDGILNPYTFLSFRHVFTPEPKTYDPELRGQVTTMRFSLQWKTC